MLRVSAEVNKHMEGVIQSAKFPAAQPPDPNQPSKIETEYWPCPPSLAAMGNRHSSTSVVKLSDFSPSLFAVLITSRSLVLLKSPYCHKRSLFHLKMIATKLSSSVFDPNPNSNPNRSINTIHVDVIERFMQLEVFRGPKIQTCTLKRPENGPGLDPTCHFKTRTRAHTEPQKCRPGKDECTLEWLKKAPKVTEAIFGENVLEFSDWLMS